MIMRSGLAYLSVVCLLLSSVTAQAESRRAKREREKEEAAAAQAAAAQAAAQGSAPAAYAQAQPAPASVAPQYAPAPQPAYVQVQPAPVAVQPQQQLQPPQGYVMVPATAVAPVQTQVVPEEKSLAPSTKDAPRSDHDLVVRRLGLGFFGVRSVPIGRGSKADEGAGEEQISAPSIGMRYWFSQRLGLDLALGFGFHDGSTEVDTPDANASADNNDRIGVAVHAGLPISFYQGQHYNFVLIPNLTFGFATGTNYDASDSDLDQDLSAMMFEVGGKIGGEVQFGFIDIPELALQATVGLNIRYASQKTKTGPSDAETRTTANTWDINTSVHDEPWDIFVGSITAIYYLP